MPRFTTLFSFAALVGCTTDEAREDHAIVAAASGPEAAVRAQLAGRADVDASALDTARVREIGAGAVVTMHQRHQGLRVIGGTVVARTDDDGSMRWVRPGTATIPAAFATAPTFDERAILDHLAAQPRFHGKRFDGARAELVIVAVGAYASAPRLAWQLDLPLDRMSAPRIFADAHTGNVLLETDQIKRAAEHTARVFLVNPIKTPQRTDVVLDKLPTGARTLADSSFDVYNCVDKRSCVGWPGEDGMLHPVHMCSFEKTAIADTSGSFAGIPTGEATTWQDPFAEVQAYYMLRKALGVVRERLAAPTLLSDVRYTVIVNTPGQFMDQPPAAACVGGAIPADSQFSPLENAAFGPLNEIPGVTFPAPLDGPVMFFGQGEKGDFAYDGGIAYHEFGHGMFHFIGSRMANGKQFPDELGMDPSQGAMDEAFADYFAMSITGDPEVGTYVGGGTAFRTADNAKTCPNDISGEEHDDSEPIAGALWSIRKSLTESDRVAMDAAVLTVMMAITDNDDVRTVADMLVAEFKTALTPAGSERARSELDTRGMLSECHDRTRVLASGEQHKQLYVSPGPAVVQFQFTLAKPASRIGLSAVSAPLADGETKPTAILHLKAGKAPIRWTWNAGKAESDATHRIPITFTPGENAGLYNAVGAVAGKFSSGTYQMQIESTDARQLIFGRIAGGVIDGKGDDGGDAGDSGGCSAGSRAASLVPLAALALVLRRRRRSLR